MATSFSLFSGFNRSSVVPAGNFANASSVGAKTVKGPLPFRVSTRPAACSAAVKVLNEPAATAVSTMSLVGGALARANAPSDNDKVTPITAVMNVALTLFLELFGIFVSSICFTLKFLLRFLCQDLVVTLALTV